MNKLISSSVYKDIEKSVNLAKELNVGIEISRLPDGLNIDKEFQEIKIYLRKILKGFNNPISFHGLFFDLNVASKDETIKEISKKRYRQSLDIAQAIGAQTLLFHTTKKTTKHIGAQKIFEKGHKEFWESFIKEIEKSALITVLENVHESTPEFILNLINHINSKQLKYALDVGHINVYSQINVLKWIDKCKDSLYHMHFHNNHGNDDSHNSLLNGNLKFDEIIMCLKQKNIEPNIVFEIFNKEDVINSIEYFDQINCEI